MQIKTRHDNIHRAIKTIRALNRRYGVTATELRTELSVSHVKYAQSWIDAASIYLPVAEIGSRQIEGNNKAVTVYGMLTT